VPIKSTPWSERYAPILGDLERLRGEIARGEAFDHPACVEAGQHVASDPPEGAADHVDHTVDVMEGEGEEDPVVDRPLPRVDQ
jgi:hypothetical protein